LVQRERSVNAGAFSDEGGGLAEARVKLLEVREGQCTGDAGHKGYWEEKAYERVVDERIPQQKDI
jgi:hypothetical protein